MMKTKTTIILIALLITALLVGCAGRGPTGKAIEQPDPITLGSILILSGEGASWGTASKNGIDLAIQDLNQKGGVLGRPLEADHQDDASDPKKSVTAFKMLRETKDIDVIIGTTWSHTGLPLIEMAEQSETLIVSPSLGMAEFNEGSDFLFNTWPHDAILSAELAELVHKRGIRKVAMIGAQQVWVKEQTTAFKERFEELGGEVVILVEPDPSDMTPYADASKIKQVADECDAIVSTTDGVRVGGRVAVRLKELGVDLPIYSITIDQDTIDDTRGAYEGLEFLTSLTPTDTFKQRYETEFGTAIDIGAASAYDAVMMIAQAMEETGSTDPVVLKDYMGRIKTVKGVSGDLTADGKGGFTKPFTLMKVIDGKMQKT